MPEHKLTLVAAYKTLGHVLAVTGDAVNHALIWIGIAVEWLLILSIIHSPTCEYKLPLISF